MLAYVLQDLEEDNGRRGTDGRADDELAEELQRFLAPSNEHELRVRTVPNHASQLHSCGMPVIRIHLHDLTPVRNPRKIMTHRGGQAIQLEDGSSGIIVAVQDQQLQDHLLQ